MDYSLELWREQNQSEQSASAKMPALLLEQQRRQSYGSGLALCVPEPDIRNGNLPAIPDPSVAACPRKGGLFSSTQWQELEVQLLIFKYMVAGIPVPADLILLVQRSLSDKLPFQHHLYQQNQRYQTGVVPTGYWGREAADSEPGRCRRTDGKKWRCSKAVVAGKKYCERHLHRGRNRSRKLVEDPTPNSAPATDFKTTTSSAPSGLSKCSTVISLSGPSSSSDLIDFSQSSMTESSENQLLYEETFDANSSSKVLRRFFEDSPSGCSDNTFASPHSAHFSMSSPAGNASSQFSLKLATDNNEMVPGYGNIANRNARWTGWANNLEASSGSPLAEALRASALTSVTSPTSVLLKSNRSLSETSSFSG